MKTIPAYISLLIITVFFTACSSTKVSKVSCPTFKSTASKSFKKKKNFSYKKKTNSNKTQTALKIKPIIEQHQQALPSALATKTPIIVQELEYRSLENERIPQAPSIETTLSQFALTAPDEIKEEKEEKVSLKDTKTTKRQLKIQKKVEKKIKKLQKKQDSNSKTGNKKNEPYGLFGSILSVLNPVLSLGSALSSASAFWYTLFPLFGIVSLVLGIIGKHKMQQEPNRYKQNRNAKMAITLSIITILLSLSYFILLLNLF